MRHVLSPSRMIVGLALVMSVSSGCASVKNLAWNPFGDRIKDRENRYSFAQVMERNGDNQRAERNYRTLIEEAPKDARYYHRLGVVLVRQGKLNDGIAMLTKAHDLDEDDLTVMNDLGYAYTIDGQFFEAEAVFRQAMKLDSRDVRTQNNLAMVLGYMGKTDEAYEMFRRNTDEGTARNNLAYIHAQSGNMSLAVKEYSKALSHSPGNKSAAEALIQLNTLNQTIATSKKQESKVQLASDRTTATSDVLSQGRAQPASHDGDERTDLVQLLNDVEDLSDEQPQSDPWATPARSVKPVTVDYDWSSAP